MTERPDTTLPAVDEIADPDEIRVVLYINGQQVHAPLPALLAHLQAQIDDHETRIAALEP